MTQLELPPPALEHLPLSLSCIQMCPKSSKFKATKPNAACLNTFQIKQTKNKTRFLQIFRAMGVLYPKLYTLMWSDGCACWSHQNYSFLLMCLQLLVRLWQRTVIFSLLSLHHFLKKPLELCRLKSYTTLLSIAQLGSQTGSSKMNSYTP